MRLNISLCSMGFCLWNHQNQNRPLKEKSISLLRSAGLLLPPTGSNWTVYAPLKINIWFGKCTKKYPFQIWRLGIHVFCFLGGSQFSPLENGGNYLLKMKFFSNGSILPSAFLSRRSPVKGEEHMKYEYPLGNGISPCSIGNISSKGQFSIAMLVTGV